MIGGRLMSWLLPNRVQAQSARLDAILAETSRARVKATQTAREVVASVAADEEKIEQTRREIRRRTEQRLERAKERPPRDPRIQTAMNALKLLERH